MLRSFFYKRLPVALVVKKLFYSRSDVFSLDTATAAGGVFATEIFFTGKGGVFAGSFVRTVPPATPDAIGVGGATARFKEGMSFFDGS